MYQCGGMLVMGKKGKENAAVFSNMADGKKRWEFGGTDFIFAAFEIDNSSILLATAFNLYKIDAATGKEIWKSAISQDVEMMEDMGALGGLLKKVAAKHAENNSSVTAVELYVRPEINSFFLAVEVLKEEHVTSSDGKTTVNKSPQSTCNGFSINDGRLLWSKGYTLDGRLASVVPSVEGLILINAGNPPMPGVSMSMGSGKNVEYPQVNINLLGYSDGKGKWGKDGRGLKLRNPAQKILSTEKGIICVTDNAVNIIDTRTGALRFEKDARVFSDICAVTELESALLLCSEDEMNLLDLKTGKTLWKKSFKTAPGLYAVDGNKLFVFYTKDKKVYTTDLKSGAAPVVLSVQETKFQGNEKPSRLELRKDGILLLSEQNLELVSFDGKSIYKAYFPAPRDPAIVRALYYATAVRAAYYGVAAGSVSMQLTDLSQKTDDPLGKPMAQMFSATYGAYSYAAFGVTGEAFKRANQRYKATEQTRDFVFILTRTEKECSLLQVNKNDGKVVESIDLGRDKTPVYSVDDLAGKIYYRSEPKKIECYRF